MLAILSPAKNFWQIPLPDEKLVLTQPQFPEKTNQLVNQLQKYFPDELADVMKMSVKLGEENYIRFQNFFHKNEAGYAGLLSYQGEAFKGVDAASFTREDLQYAQNTVRVLSGLYGAVRPLDEIKPYRLEMQTQFKSGEVQNLYTFWKAELTQYILQAVLESPGEKALVNVASQEYTKALDLKQLSDAFPVIHIHFKEQKGDKLRVVSMYAKRARGLFIQYMVKNRVEDFSSLQDFQADGYCFRTDLSTKSEYVFTR